jgi:hypothetical protein
MVLSSNPNAISLLKDNQDKIDWHILSSNPNAISLLKDNQDKINWHTLSSNPNAISLLKDNQDNIDWYELSSNENQDAIELLKDNQGKIYFKTKSGYESSILPEDGDIFIFPGDLQHKPEINPNSTKPRIVVAGNVAIFDNYIAKSKKTFL